MCWGERGQQETRRSPGRRHPRLLRLQSAGHPLTGNRHFGRLAYHLARLTRDGRRSSATTGLCLVGEDSSGDGWSAGRSVCRLPHRRRAGLEPRRLDHGREEGDRSMAIEESFSARFAVLFSKETTFAFIPPGRPFFRAPPRLRHRCESGALHRDTFVNMSFYTLHERTSKEGRTVHRYLAFCAWWLLPRPRLARNTGMCCPGKRSGKSQCPLERRMLCLALARTPSGWTCTAC